MTNPYKSPQEKGDRYDSTTQSGSKIPIAAPSERLVRIVRIVAFVLISILTIALVLIVIVGRS